MNRTIYSDSDRAKNFESVHTHTLFYLAQATKAAGDSDASARNVFVDLKSFKMIFASHYLVYNNFYLNPKNQQFWQENEIMCFYTNLYLRLKKRNNQTLSIVTVLHIKGCGGEGFLKF